MRVLIASVEMSPLAKVGGLADVAGSLPKALVGRGHDVRVMLPLHAGIDTASHGFTRVLADVPVETPRGAERASVWEGRVEGVTTYLVEAMDLFERPNIYGEPDDAQRFLFFSDALLATVPQLQWTPEVLHLQDWHTAFVSARLRGGIDHPLSDAAIVYTIHNLALRGDFDRDFADANGIAVPRVQGIDPSILRSGMALGIMHADMVSTVSRTYAREILTPEFGAGLDPLLRRRSGSVAGIVNGIDMDAFDPARDPAIIAPYSAGDPSGKAENKAALQRETGLPIAPDLPLVGVVNRLFWQKGMDLAADAVADVLAGEPLQLIVLGTGEWQYEQKLQALARRFPDQVRVILAFDPPLGQRIYAGSDLFLMPSRYEPCGLGQLIAMRYGSVPVVRRTGGLADTVADVDESADGTGFQFGPADAAALAAALRRALAYYRRSARWRDIQQRDMRRDFSWNAAAAEYVGLYERALARVRS
jgi:starch synthase